VRDDVRTFDRERTGAFFEIGYVDIAWSFLAGVISIYDKALQEGCQLATAKEDCLTKALIEGREITFAGRCFDFPVVISLPVCRTVWQTDARRGIVFRSQTKLP
jgi:hypothetical protein